MARSEFDMRNYDWSKSQRGKYLSKAERSLGTLILEREIVEKLGGPDKAVAILRTIAAAIPSAGKFKRRKAA
ncbi:MAG: hypothetical protein IPL79_03975 [Myxococcales bacterium]|nr:hypothetical protein [Myxococcales bacterium]